MASFFDGTKSDSTSDFQSFYYLARFPDLLIPSVYWEFLQDFARGNMPLRRFGSSQRQAQHNEQLWGQYQTISVHANSRSLNYAAILRYN